MVQFLLAIIYLAFISLGLPDSVLGSAWPSMYEDLNVPISYAGIISMIIAVGTIVSSLYSDAMNKKIGTGRVMVISVGMTAMALLGFSFSTSFWMLCICAVPYGLGAGSVDAALNNYVALHYESHHMSWLHCMWGVGTIIGPTIMGYTLTGGQGWNVGYRTISFLQIGLTVILFITLPLWKKNSMAIGDSRVQGTKREEPLSLVKVIHIPGAKEVIISFFAYCAVEQTTMLWASSYMVLHNGMSVEKAAGCASSFFIGITIGRFLSGFLTLKFNDTQMIRIGQILVIIGGFVLLLPLGTTMSLVGIIMIGLGCAPIYPCIIHSTPKHFGEDKSQAMIGIQMASAYTGTCLMPPLFGLIANHIDVALLPVYLLVLACIMIVVHERLLKKTDMQQKRIILASASPRRKELLTQAGYKFEIQVSHKEETYTATTPNEIVKELALLKARDIAKQNLKNNLVIIGADTVVAHHGKILGKPSSKEEAFRMIKGFQGDQHQVYTGVAILDYDAEGKETVVNHAVKTDVYVHAMNDDEIWDYIEKDNVMDKAGSYGIQSGFAVHIEKIEGDYFNVVGLPVSYIYQELKKMTAK